VSFKARGTSDLQEVEEYDGDSDGEYNYGSYSSLTQKRKVVSRIKHVIRLRV
jgi:hypothetical protein